MKAIDSSRLSWLVLDYLRPFELKQTLESIEKYCKCDYEVVVHANGGNQDYHVEYYNQGLIDRLILNKLNNGAGRGCVDLFNYCLTDYALYLEGDQPLIRDLTQDEVDRWKRTLDQKKSAPVISVVGQATGGQFSQRAFFSCVSKYRELSKSMPNGGPGPFNGQDTNEHFMQEYILNNDLILFHSPTLVMDMGCYRIEQSKDGSIWLNRTDTRALWMIKGPAKEKGSWPNLSDDEWNQLLDYEIWPDGAIPELDKPHSFVHWKDRNDQEVVEELRKQHEN